VLTYQRRREGIGEIFVGEVGWGWGLGESGWDVWFGWMDGCVVGWWDTEWEI
jgi:hypothetical protein